MFDATSPRKMETTILLDTKNRMDSGNNRIFRPTDKINESCSLVSLKNQNLKILYYSCDNISDTKQEISNLYDHNHNRKIFSFWKLPTVEASLIDSTSNLDNSKSNFQSVTSQDNAKTNNATTNNFNSRFSSPFSTLTTTDFMSSNNATTTSTTNSAVNKQQTFAATFTTTAKNSTTSATTLEKYELVHQQNYSNPLNIWSRLNLVSLSIPPISIFTIKSVVNSSSPSQNQVQRKSSQSLANNIHQNINVIDSSYLGQVIESSSKAATALPSTSTSPITSSLLHPSNNKHHHSNNNNCKIINKNKRNNIASTSIENKTIRRFPSYGGDCDTSPSPFLVNEEEIDHQQQQLYFDDSISVIDEEHQEGEEKENYEAFYESSPSYHKIFSNPQYKHLTMSDKRRLERLFKEIDVDGNGVIDFNDLLQALEQKGIQATHENVKHLILRSDINLDGDIDFAEFVSYCLENEKQLRIIFKDIDVNSDGKIDAHELVLAFERAGINVDEQEALRLVKRIKADSKNPNALELNYNEFRDYLLLHPTDSLQDLMRSWRFGTFVELGEDGIMPVDFSENEIKTGMWWRHMLAGGVAGAVSRTSTAPLDRLKVFLQVRGAEFNGLTVCLRHMIQEGGVLSLWRGNGINVLKIAPETAMKFMTFDQLKRLIHSGDPNSEITIMERFLAGSLAGAVSQTVIYPMEVLKTRFCLRQTGQYKGLWDAAQKIYSNGGIKNFYRGYVPNLIGIIPYAGIDLTIYETLKKMYMKSHSLEEAPVYVCLTCGTVSSTFGQIASYPLALIRTRMQSESGHHHISMVDMFRTILKREGPRGLYRGITANIMKVAPAVSISYVVYEYTRRPLGAIMS